MSDEVEEVEGTDRTIRLARVGDVRFEMARVYREMRTGKLPMQDGTKLIYCLVQLAQVTHLSVVEAKVDAIDQTMREKGMLSARSH